MARNRPFFVMAASVLLALGMPSCTGDRSSSTHSPTGSSEKGGVYRTAIEDLGFSAGFDPTAEYAQTGLALDSQLLLRSLVTYRHVAGPAGNELVPDLAQEIPDPSSDGLTYTFHLKEGIRFGPPLDREITSNDIEYAFERIDTVSLAAQYGHYYDGTIVGMNRPVPGGPEDISGIDTPDIRTIVFHLRQPTGDFLYRLALPATAPVPPEVGRCFEEAGTYGRDVIASGPYMIQGEDRLDISSCDTIEPISGFDPTRRMLLVRNPEYDPSTDSAEDRENFLDGVSIVTDTNTDDIFEKIEAGELDGSWVSHLPSAVQQRYGTDPNLRGLLRSGPAEVTNFLSLNLLTPPFDDIHVRKAVNYVIDKTAMQQASGGPSTGDIATHIFPPGLLPEFPSSYDPYPSPSHRGNLEAARTEMKRSGYDRDGDGRCDASACSNVDMVTVPYPPYDRYSTIVQSNLAQLGIQLRVRDMTWTAAYRAIQSVGNLVPLAGQPGWGKDIPDPYSFAVLFSSGGIRCDGQINYSEVGMTVEQANECGVDEEFRQASPVPSLDGRIASCEALLNGPDRSDCWIALDRYLMEEVVPFVPYQWLRQETVLGRTVTKYVYDQNTNLISLCHIAVSNDVDTDTLS